VCAAVHVNGCKTIIVDHSRFTRDKSALGSAFTGSAEVKTFDLGANSDRECAFLCIGGINNEVNAFIKSCENRMATCRNNNVGTVFAGLIQNDAGALVKLRTNFRVRGRPSAAVVGDSHIEVVADNRVESGILGELNFAVESVSPIFGSL